jgi:hypothetical protein
MGMIGEQHFGDNTIWLTKTHAPFFKESAPYLADKIICIIRNPIEVFPSMASLYNTGSHTLEPEKPWNQYDFWESFIRYFAPKMEIFA